MVENRQKVPGLTFSPGGSFIRWLHIVGGMLVLFLYAKSVQSGRDVNAGDFAVILFYVFWTYILNCIQEELMDSYKRVLSRWSELLAAIEAAMPHMSDNALKVFFAKLGTGRQTQKDNEEKKRT